MYGLLFSQVGGKTAPSGIVFARAFLNAGRLFSDRVSSRIYEDISYFDHIRWYAGRFEVP